MTNKSTQFGHTQKTTAKHTGMMGDGTEEQNLNQRGDPKARINKKEVVAAFGKRPIKKSSAKST